MQKQWTAKITDLRRNKYTAQELLIEHALIQEQIEEVIDIL